MAKNDYKFYECVNPDCRLRFPGQENMHRGNRCPVCRSPVSVVNIQSIEVEQNNSYVPQENKTISVLLDNIRSAWNVGSIFRTADGFGIKKIYCCGITPTPENPKVAKTALGAEKDIQWEQFNNGLLASQNLKSQGILLISLEDFPGSQPLFNYELNSQKRTVFVLGNEITGIDPGIIEMSDVVLSIQMVGMKRSHNVAIAFAIAASYLYYCQIVSQESRRIFPST